MKWENASTRRKAKIVEGVCKYIGLEIEGHGRGFFVEDPNGFAVVGDRSSMFFESADNFLFGNLRDDHTPASLSGTGLWSLEQNVSLGFTTISMAALAKFASLKFSSLSALELQLTAAGVI